MNRILNLTVNPVTQVLRNEGVFDTAINRDAIRELVIFNAIPTYMEMKSRAKRLISLIEENHVCEVLIDGPTFFIPILVKTLLDNGKQPYSEVSTDTEFLGLTTVFSHDDYIS